LRTRHRKAPRTVATGAPETPGSRLAAPVDGADFPIRAGILFGLGLGGFFDGIVLHQILQWHHMLTDAGYPASSVENLQLNTLWDGLFHATTYVFVVLGLIVLWRASRRTHIRWSSKLLVGSLLMGFDIFNLVEGVVDHHLLGIHHVDAAGREAPSGPVISDQRPSCGGSSTSSAPPVSP
jgi:uncharacterized membrane protein